MRQLLSIALLTAAPLAALAQTPPAASPAEVVPAAAPAPAAAPFEAPAAPAEAPVPAAAPAEAAAPAAPAAATAPTEAAASAPAALEAPAPAAASPAAEPVPSAAPMPSSSEAPASLAATVETAPAQPDIARSGAYFGVGVGGGVSTLSPEALAGGSAALLSFRSGLAIFDWLLAGVTLVWQNQYNAYVEDEHVGSSLSSMMGEVTYFPLPALPWSVAAGAGWGSGLSVTRITDFDGNPRFVAAGGNGLSWMAASGWDFGAGPGLNLGVQARYDGASLSDGIGTVHGGSLHLWMNFY